MNRRRLAFLFVAACASSSRFAQANEDSFDAIVVGSGYGGSVAALRLAEGGEKTLVLERGRWWTVIDGTKNETFATLESVLEGAEARATWLDDVRREFVSEFSGSPPAPVCGRAPAWARTSGA